MRYERALRNDSSVYIRFIQTYFQFIIIIYNLHECNVSHVSEK